MSGTVELDADGSNLLIRFPYREDLVAVVKDLPGRRWDPRQKVWRVPANHVEQVFAALSRHLFEFAPEIPQLLAGTLRLPAAKTTSRPQSAPAAASPAAATTNSTEAGDVAAPALTISQLNSRVRDGLRELFPAAIWVVGEVVDFDKTADREHHFFQLVEKSPGNQRPAGAVEVALFGGTAERLLPRLAAGEAPLTLRDGIEIRALVKVDLYPASGRYQVVVQDIDPSFTLGKLALSREQILRELRDKGLAERNRSLGFPIPALRIGVLTSPDADGWNDFLRHLQESGIGFAVTLFPVRVQGAELKPSLLAGLAWFERHNARFDVLCIVRGGGSRTDLAGFDDRDLALAVARHPLKIVVGIGHQRDQSVLDLIAHSEKTPTAVAELLVRGIESAREDLGERAARLANTVADHLATETRRLDRLGRDLQRAIGQRLRDAATGLAAAGRQLDHAVMLRLSRERGTLAAGAARVRHGAARLLDRQTARLDQQAVRQRLLDPVRVVARGFAIVRDAAGKVLPAAARLTPAAAVQLQLRDGRADAHIDHIHLDSP